jgi:hypothetical protein
LTGFKRALLTTALCLGVFSTPAQTVAQDTPRIDVAQLQPGEYRWAPDIAPEGPVSIIISLQTQMAYAYRNGVRIGVSTVSTGKPGYETPTGLFVILQKDIDHKSNLYDDAPMPFMQRLTWDGIAMHAGNIPGYPASHGCIRLPTAFAKLLFGITKLGLTVVITDEPNAPVTVATPAVLELSENDDRTALKTYQWTPQKSPTGPVSVIVSGHDKRVIVIRNGIEIGSGHIEIDQPIKATEAFTLGAVDADGAHWFRLPLPGQQPSDAIEMTRQEHGRVHMPGSLREAIISTLQPGATLLVTNDALRSGSTGKHLTIIVGDDEQAMGSAAPRQ